MRDGEPDKAGYRRYKVKGVAGQDDFAMIHEVLSRRLRRALAEGSFPDLLVIDGGKGQLGAALAAAKDAGIATRPVPGNPGVPFVEMAGLAKSRLLESGERRASRRRLARSERGDRGGRPLRPPRVEAARLADAAEAAEQGFVGEAPRSPERVFLPGRKDPVVLRQNSAELFLLTRVRDEAHRFAIAFHRKLRRGRSLQSVLEEIPGVGAGRRGALLRALGSLKRIREASIEEIARVEGFGPRQARAVHEFFHGPKATAGDPVGGASEEEIDRALAEEGAGDPSGHPL
jgi:excinuclease ABC subunit C